MVCLKSTSALICVRLSRTEYGDESNCLVPLNNRSVARARRHIAVPLTISAHQSVRPAQTIHVPALVRHHVARPRPRLLFGRKRNGRRFAAVQVSGRRRLATQVRLAGRRRRVAPRQDGRPARQTLVAMARTPLGVTRPVVAMTLN